jgi:hypothetical protein
MELRRQLNGALVIGNRQIDFTFGSSRRSSRIKSGGEVGRNFYGF